MGRASQDHKLNTRGYDSLGRRKALVDIKRQHGFDTASGTLAILSLSGLWSGTDTITVTVNIGGGNLTPSYSPAGNEDAIAAASGLATQITAETDVTATASAGNVYCSKSTSGVINIISAAIT